jgi:hypothetical protein
MAILLALLTQVRINITLNASGSSTCRGRRSPSCPVTHGGDADSPLRRHDER